MQKTFSTSYEMHTIGVIHSCFKEKFGIPRQAGLVPEARASLELLPPYDRPEALLGLEGFSHLWIVFVFHQAQREQWSPLVRPPRLGGNQRIGVFASRAPFRPNPIGLSLVALEGISQQGSKLSLELSGVDLLDGTPVLDIKPYLPYADALPEARAGYAQQAPEAPLVVHFSAAAEARLATWIERYPELRRLIEQLLAADPRPAYQSGKADGRRYGMRLWDFDVRWEVDEDGLRVTDIVPLASGKQ